MKQSTQPLPTELQTRLIRFDELVACKTAFIDAKSPGSDQKENFCMIGGGVAENPDQVVHINIPHGFDIGGARQPRGCKNSHHSHDTEEVFFVHKGRWKITWGHDGGDGEVILHRGDTISIPTHVFRGFENVGPDDGFLYAILGLYPDGTAGRVTWAPYVFEQAKAHGLVLLDDGRLIDTSAGIPVPDNAKTIEPISLAQLKEFKKLNADDLTNCIARADEPLAIGGHTDGEAVCETAIIGVANKLEKIGAGKMSWKHGFQVRRLSLQPGAQIADHKRTEEEVLFVHEGCLELIVSNTSIDLHAGDLFSVPINAPRSYKNTSKNTVEIIVVRRGNSPAAAQFC